MRFLFVFFFQAEDGIRDWSVTGVQTCALPISGAFVGSIILDPKNGFASGFERGFDVYNAGFHRQKTGERREASMQRREIGRASCRERVKIPVVEVAMKIKHQIIM